MRSTPSRSRFTLVVLILAIVSWGFVYKVSVYDQPQSNFHPILQAKFFPRNQQAVEGRSPLLSDAALPVPVRTVLFCLVMLPAASFLSKLAPPTRRKLDSEEPSRRRRLAGLNSFFVRPPPILT